MRVALRAAAWVAACLLLLSAKEARPRLEFTHENYFRFGMSLADAEQALKQSKDFRIAYRIDTTQTADLACVYQGVVYYRLSFYQGRCYSMEKRAELPQDQIDPTFDYFKGKLGATPEATRSQDLSLLYARWKFKDREISLTGSVRTSGLYMLTYEEVDSETAGEARRVQEDELQSAPQQTDPLTGKPRQVQGGVQAEDGAQAEPQDNGTAVGELAPADQGAAQPGDGKDAAKEKAAKEKAARERAAKEQAAKERAAKEKAALEKAKEKAKGKDAGKEQPEDKDGGKKQPEKPADPGGSGGVEMD